LKSSRLIQSVSSSGIGVNGVITSSTTTEN